MKSLPSIKTMFVSMPASKAFTASQILKNASHGFMILGVLNYANEAYKGNYGKAITGLGVMGAGVYLAGVSAVVCPPCALTAIAGTAMYSLVLEPMLFPEPKVIPMTK